MKTHKKVCMNQDTTAQLVPVLFLDIHKYLGQLIQFDWLREDYEAVYV